MEEEGTYRNVDGVETFCDSQGGWHDISEADMSHIDAAVLWWNREGYKYGPRSIEVRNFMNDPSNYILDHYSINRSEGHTLPTYRDPLLE